MLEILEDHPASLDDLQRDILNMEINDRYHPTLVAFISGAVQSLIDENKVHVCGLNPTIYRAGEDPDTYRYCVLLFDDGQIYSDIITASRKDARYGGWEYTYPRTQEMLEFQKGTVQRRVIDNPMGTVMVYTTLDQARAFKKMIQEFKKAVKENPEVEPILTDSHRKILRIIDTYVKMKSEDPTPAGGTQDLKIPQGRLGNLIGGFGYDISLSENIEFLVDAGYLTKTKEMNTLVYERTTKEVQNEKMATTLPYYPGGFPVN